MSDVLGKIRKALVAGVAAGLAVVADSAATGNLDHVNLAVVAGAAFAAALAVWGVRNKA